MSKDEVVLLDFELSPFCIRVRIALAEKGVQYEGQEEDLFGGKSELLQKSNPIYEKVFDGGAAIWRSKGDELELAKNEFIDILKKLEGAMGDKDYLGGDTFGFLDIVLIGSSSWFPAYEKFGGFKIEDECPKIGGWIKRCKEGKVWPKLCLILSKCVSLWNAQKDAWN
ncbi:UNVERIFIED_CONTAM: putative glutathione S-transferase parA [Sesamum latifolium]|uniref:Glutathione S-transferase n=1 Tax=Sesamum latifolium TaxID=2727402 RepID=A0AAW2Y9J5_9LAMI